MASAGEIVSIIGANGAGKPSFLKALVRQAGRVTGNARFDGEDLAAFATRDIVAKGVALAPEGRRVRDRGVAVCVVEQDITRSLAVADRFYCFLEGEVSMSGRPADADRETIMQHYFGA